MGITSRSSKPSEWASKINHTHIINDSYIKAFLGKCVLPRDSYDIDRVDFNVAETLDSSIENPIKYILAVDGGYTTVDVKKNFPSAQFAFFQFGAVLFKTADLEKLSEKPFIFPA